MIRYLIIFFLGLSIISCNTDIEGELLPNEAPDTYTVVDTIIRVGEDRLESQVEILWWGNDPDGFIQGYEYTFDQVIDEATIWNYTEQQDSVFLLSTPAGEDTIDFRFSVRAIDNKGIADPSPASVWYPVKNSPPSVTFVPGTNNPVRTFPVLKLFWEGNDPDGFENLSHFELYWNDTLSSPYIIDKSAESATFEALDPGILNPDCKVYLNNNLSPESETIAGMELNSWNNLYIRAVDNSQARSAYSVSDSVFIKKQNSQVLLLNAYTSGSGPSVETFYASKLIDYGIDLFDTIRIFQQAGGEYTQLSSDNLTQGKILDLFDLIIWFGNDAESSFSLAQRTTTDFFADDGKLFMSVYVSSAFDEQSDFLDFTPIASLVDPVDTTLVLNNGALISPLEPGWPELESTSILGVVKPIILNPGAEALYDAQLSYNPGLGDWNGESTVMARKLNNSGETIFIISTIELQRLDGMMNTGQFFSKVLGDEFGF